MRATLILIAACLLAGPAQAGRLTPGCRAAQVYLGYLNAMKADAIGKLFAGHADYMGPDGAMRHTPAEMYGKAFAASGRSSFENKITHLVPIDKDACLMEFEAKDPATGVYKPIAVDHFQVDQDGKVILFLPYLLPAQMAGIHQILDRVAR